MSLHQVTDQGGSGRADQRAVRRANLGVVLRHVASDGPLSRASIAAGTGLNKTTVSSLVAELIDHGPARRDRRRRAPGDRRPAGPDGAAEPGRGAVARPRAPLRLPLRLLHRPLRRRPLRARASPSPTATAIRRASSTRSPSSRGEALAAADAQGVPAVGVTLAGPGLVDVRAGVLVSSPDLGWEHVPVVEMLGRRLDRPGLPIRADNESNLGALAELWAGAGQRLRDFIYVSSPHGVGAGIVLDGQLYRGRARLRGRARARHRRSRGAAVHMREPRLPGDAGGRGRPAGDRGRARHPGSLGARGRAVAGPSATARATSERWAPCIASGTGWASAWPARSTCSTRRRLCSAAAWASSRPGSSSRCGEAFAVGTLADDACEILASRLGDCSGGARRGCAGAARGHRRPRVDQAAPRRLTLAVSRGLRLGLKLRSKMLTSHRFTL